MVSKASPKKVVQHLGLNCGEGWRGKEGDLPGVVVKGGQLWTGCGASMSHIPDFPTALPWTGGGSRGSRFHSCMGESGWVLA